MLNRTKKYILVVLFFFHVFVSAVYATDDLKPWNTEKLKDLNQILNRYTDKSFDTYLKSRTHYNIADFKTVIYSLFAKYKNEFAKSNGCASAQKFNKTPNMDWIDELIKLAGKEYISDNINSFVSLFGNLSAKQSHLFCLSNNNNLILSEMDYFGVVEEFLNEYLLYVKTLPPEQQKAKKGDVKAAKNMIERKPPWQEFTRNNNIQIYLPDLHQVELKLEIINFILSRPELAQPFDPMAILKELPWPDGREI